MTLTSTPPAAMRQVHIEQVLNLFDDPPSLTTVAADCAQAYLDQYCAGRNYSARLIYLATPDGPYRSLPDLVMARLAAARPTLLAEGYQHVVQRVRETYAPGGPSLAELEGLINRCGARLLGFFSRRLQAWWNEPLPLHMTRWGYLADELLALLYDSPPPPGMSAECFARVFPRSALHGRRPNREWSAHGPALRVQTLHLRRGASVQMLALLLLQTATQTFLFSPACGVQRLDTPDSLPALLPAYASPLLAGAGGQWFAVEVQGDPFDALAASYLALQLQEIALLDPLVPRSVEDYQALLGMITDSRRWFVAALSPRQQTLREQLPLWLVHATPDQCIAYAQLLQALVLARQHSGARHFLDGIPSLQGYANERLQACLRKDARAAALSPADIRLTFERVIAAAVPVPGGFIAGQVERFHVSLTEWALENLVGFAHTVKAIRLKGEPAPAWLSYELLQRCVTEADIGQRYPALLKQQLIGNPNRRQLFSLQLRVQLPMQALEWQIKGEHGLTQAGFRRLRAALQPSATSDAFWPLAFKAVAGATADEVANMFIIGPRQGEVGPHLLYRPLFEPPLQEFPSLKALFEAIRQPGALQDSVLTWLAPQRQAVYANGGFDEPRTQHFLQGDEFTRYEQPAPAQLSKSVLVGDPTDHLFTAMAQALASLAERQTVSNAEQRWASLKQVGWLLFGTLQPLLTGPLMLVGWLVQLVDSARQDIVALQGTDEQAKNAALVDLLANLMVVVAHQATPHDARRHLEVEHPVFAPLALAEPPPLPPVRIAPPAQFLAPSGWANARDTLTPEMWARLQRFSLHSFAAPWPVALEGAETSGPWQGLVRDTQRTPPRWLALVQGHKFRVRMEHGRVRVISADGMHRGPWLKAVGQGRWEVDLQLRLLGGAGDGAIEPVDNRQVLENQYRQATQKRARAQSAMELARTLANKPADEVTEQQRTQAQARYFKALEEKLELCQDELQLLRRLRDQGPRPRYEEELSQILESIILTIQLLDADSRTRMHLRNLQLRPLLEAGDEQTHAELNQGLRELAVIHDNVIRWRILEQRYLDELRQVPRLGRDKARALAELMPVRPSVLDLQSLQLTTLWGLAIDVPGLPFEDDLFENMSTTVDRARWASRSLAELSQVHSSEAERVELLDSIDHVFAQTDDRIEFWRAMEPDRFNLAYLQQLQGLLATLHRNVEQQLAGLLQPQAQEVFKAPPDTSGKRRNKIIRTRNHDLYVARMSPEPTGVDTAQMLDAAGSVIGSFTEAEDGVWDLENVTPPARPDPELNSLLKKANLLLGETDKAIAHVEAMVVKANDAASLQELLDAQARSRLWAAEAIGRKLRGLDNARLAAVQQANARTAEASLRAAVAKLEAAGLSARVRATRNKTLTQTDVAFLHSHNEVRVHRQGARVKLKGDDFLQVYAVNDVHTGKPLCFAHFHYGRSEGPDDHFTAAHLKSPEQERLGRQAQAAVEAQAFARMRTGQTGRVQQTLEIRRAQIGLALARQLFFSVD